MISKYAVTLDGTAGITFLVLTTDAVQEFSTAQMQNANGVNPIACLITCEGNDVRFAFNVDPTQGALGSGALGHALIASSSMVIQNTNSIANYRFLNAVQQSAAYIQVTMFYEIGK
jgi:hypothetical protein